ncbi:FecCD family ABC transporter permease [Fusibacter sp. JL298sf-3]
MIESNAMRRLSYLGLFAAFAALFVFGLSFGFIKMSVPRVLQTLLGEGTSQDHFTLFTLRMPRLIITAVMGMALAVSGSVLQTLTRNDLADPGILGVNAGAGLGVTVAYLTLDFTSANVVLLLPVLGFVGASLTFLVTWLFSMDKGGQLNVDKLVLVGIGSGISLSGAMIVFVSSAGREEVHFIYKWLSGNIWGDKWVFVQVTVPLVLLLMAVVFLKANTMDLLGLDNISAQSLGVDLKRERRLLVAVAVALAAVVVSVAGAIAFVGLIIPHIAKRLYGPRHKHFLPGSVLLGGIFLMAADTIGRNILPPQGLLPGIVVSLVGAPYFLMLVMRKR